MARMTRARNRTQGLGNPPLIQLWLEAVLCAFVSLVQGARTTLGMIFKCNHRDWHTADAHEDLPQATSGIQLQDNNPTHGVILGLVPRISVGTPRGLSIDPREAINQDSRVKPENNSVDVAPSRFTPVIPGEGATCLPKPEGRREKRRRPGTQGRQAQASTRAAPGFRLALTRVRNDTVHVSTHPA